MIQAIRYADRAEWKDIRRQYIGGSDAAAVIGLNPYKSGYALWAEKTGRIPEFGGNITTRVGAYLEDLVAHMFEEETGKKVRRLNRTLINDEYPFACANVDRVVIGEGAVLEIKTTNSPPALKKFRHGEYPETWYCQMTHYLAVGKYEKAYLAVLVGCRELLIFELERDEQEISALMDAEREFWQHVTDDTPPDADGSKSTSEALRSEHPEDDGESVELNAYVTDLARYMELKRQIGTLSGEADEIKNRICAFMGSAGEGYAGRYSVRYATQERRTFDAKRFAADFPGIDLSKYYNRSTSRPFRISETE